MEGTVRKKKGRRSGGRLTEYAARAEKGMNRGFRLRGKNIPWGLIILIGAFIWAIAELIHALLYFFG